MTGKRINKDEIQAKTFNTCKRIGLQIRAARKSKGMTQEQLAEWADVSAKHLSAIENGKEKNISIGYLISIGAVLNIELHDWL
jgi:transcriptional regulator with XRE-family HTH domain